MRTPPPRYDLRFSSTTGILQKKTLWFIGVELEQETSAPPPKKIPGSALAVRRRLLAKNASWEFVCHLRALFDS